MCSSTSGGSSTRVPVIDDDSVHAYRTTIGHPRRVRIFSASSGVTGAEPVDARRSDERSASASCGRSTSLLHCVGTPWPTVTRSRTIASSIASTVHGVPVSTELMTNSTWSQSLFM